MMETSREHIVAKYERKKKSGSYVSCLSSSISSRGNNLPILNNHTAGYHINNVTKKSYSRYNVEQIISIRIKKDSLYYFMKLFFFESLYYNVRR